MAAPVLAGLIGLALPAPAVQPDEMLTDPGLEARARAISQDLRCLVCQNQSIDDSNAPLARDLRLLVRERLKAGDNDDGVVAYVTARYGDFVLLKPPFQANTWLLWLGPVAILFGATAAMVRYFRARMRAPADELTQSDPLSAEEHARLRRLLDGEG
jgi:cytochrome c-type biogenesis protein CcmH